MGGVNKSNSSSIHDSLFELSEEANMDMASKRDDEHKKLIQSQDELMIEEELSALNRREQVNP